MMRMNVLVADDDEVFRRAAGRWLERDCDLHVVGEAADGLEAIRLARVLRPDVILMDITMPEVNGLEATRRIKAEQPDSKVVVLTVHDEPMYRTAAAQCGADGYVIKKDARTEVLATILAIRRANAPWAR